MKSWKICFVVLMCLIVPDTNAQYKFLLKGEQNPFDTAVAVRIDRYRQETTKLDLGQKLVDSLTYELFKTLQANYRKDTLLSTLGVKIAALIASNERRDNTIQLFDETFDFLADEAVKPKVTLWQKPIWNKKGTWFGLGVGTTVLLKVLLSK